MKKLFCSLIILVNLFSYAYAMDTDLYVVSGVDIPPNVLIILDNSASMNNEIQGTIYDPAFQYPPVFTESSNAAYYNTRQGWNYWRANYSSVACDAARTALGAQGSYRGKVDLSSSACGGSNQEFSTGNYLNYLYATGGPGDQPRFGLAKGINHSYINTTDNVRFGVMIFNYQNGGRLLYPISDTWLTEHKTGIYQALAGLHADTYTPLAETLYEAGLYFQGKPSYFNSGVNYTKPVQYYCQKNYVIIITDGEPTKDVLDLAPGNPIVTPTQSEITTRMERNRQYSMRIRGPIIWTMSRCIFETSISALRSQPSRISRISPPTPSDLPWIRLFCNTRPITEAGNIIIPTMPRVL